MHMDQFHFSYSRSAVFSRLLARGSFDVPCELNLSSFVFMATSCRYTFYHTKNYFYIIWSASLSYEKLHEASVGLASQTCYASFEA